jgi:hypothetical protein
VEIAGDGFGSGAAPLGRCRIGEKAKHNHPALAGSHCRDPRRPCPRLGSKPVPAPRTRYEVRDRSPSNLFTAAPRRAPCLRLRGVLASPKVVSRARRWSPVRAPLSLRLAAHKPTAQWPPAPPSTALEAPALGQLCLRSASAVTRWFKIPKGPKKRARTRTAQTQMVQPPTTASPRSPGGSARRQATTTAL